MDLILWRHAEAVDLELVGDDMERYLTHKGEKQATRMAAWLDRQLPEGTRIWSSPAVRAQQTAKALGRKFKTSSALAPLATAKDLLDLVGWPTAKGCVLIVGHQPTLGHVVAGLLGIGSGECALRKGAAWWLRFREREEGGQAVLLSVQTPDLL
ncbi:phosphohistidine phosphatase SixA [Curvibacter sp. APW13]|uniref:phosphohistidine phosphatase SixA n=1 Tax=Curvibacter sp. APW13 TaxID=3077236 RepID=UPI0028E063AD|nr:phosphohistidine phosphatase SixA [Curvibacter sp. APW13]MDT8992199.1 phosphohistidine phosphatase SixA [Curvibacter sp. APW13]